MAKEQGITEAEIGAVQSVVMAVSAGRVRAQFREARARVRQKAGAEPDQGGMGCCRKTDGE